jgi:predicted enzyme involved in methoxymalonyl-ACP biosynthesis
MHRQIPIQILTLSIALHGIDTWLMYYRVLGRQVEQATLNLIVQAGRQLGGHRLIGHYIPTNKNGMVKNPYARLG